MFDGVDDKCANNNSERNNKIIAIERWIVKCDVHFNAIYKSGAKYGCIRWFSASVIILVTSFASNEFK